MPQPQSSKFSGLFTDRLKEPPEPTPGRNEAPAVATPAPAPPPVSKAPKKDIGRPRGKTSNPEFKKRTVVMREDLHFDATDILHQQRKGQDLSDLINGLLETWVKKNKAS
jgi:hypothetical protein